MSDALEIVLRYIIAFGCAWAVKHGVDQSFADQNFVTAVATVVGGLLTFAAVVVRALFMSTVRRVLARLAARHRPELLAKAADVPGVHRIDADPELAASVPSDKVVAAGGR